ncbi:MAG: hypothetical protein HOP37_05480 [Cyclobacteriaceae bacterium]|nr:hypothetical protein [Cyclobacteriaceae bacterium]
MDQKSLDEWEKKYRINSIRQMFRSESAEKEAIITENKLMEFENAAEFMLATLNTKREIQIGDTIIWYNEGIKHYVPGKDENLLSRIKENTLFSTLKGEYSIGTLEERKPNKQGRIIMSATNGSLDARWQSGPFTMYKNGQPWGVRKFVHELYVTTQTMGCFPGGCNTQSTIYLRVKAEYRDSRGNWPNAGDARSVFINVSSIGPEYLSSGSLIAPYYAGNTFIYNSYVTTNNLVFGLAVGYGPTYSGYSPQWSVDVSGYIYQNFNGDLLSNAWNNEAYPLW